MIQFFLPMHPPTVTAQEHRIMHLKGKPVIYDSPELKSAKSKLTASLAAHRPETPFCSGVRLVVKWLFPVCGKHRNGEYRTSRPDTDNLQKMLKDCMTRCGFWKDDALVASEICEKFWADVPGIWIYIEELADGHQASQI